MLYRNRTYDETITVGISCRAGLLLVNDSECIQRESEHREIGQRGFVHLGEGFGNAFV